MVLTATTTTAWDASRKGLLPNPFWGESHFLGDFSTDIHSSFPSTKPQVRRGVTRKVVALPLGATIHTRSPLAACDQHP
jgi:hypothetical protein